MSLLVAASLAGCATGPQPSEVTRFHLNQPIARGQIAIEPFNQRDAGSIEFRDYADAVSRQLAANGWTVVASGQAEQVALVDFAQGSRDDVVKRSPVTIGLGGATGGWSSGVGGGISFGLGGGSGSTTASMMEVSIKRRSDGTVIWEGRARTEADARRPESSPSVAADKLAAALFQGFPGESGRTITVK
jgi:hypothetical protein